MLTRQASSAQAQPSTCVKKHNLISCIAVRMEFCSIIGTRTYCLVMEEAVL